MILQKKRGRKYDVVIETKTRKPDTIKGRRRRNPDAMKRENRIYDVIQTRKFML